MAIEMAFACKMAHFASRMRVAAHVRVCARVAHVCAHTPQAQRILVKTRSCVRASRVAHYARGKFPQFATFSLTGGLCNRNDSPILVWQRRPGATKREACKEDSSLPGEVPIRGMRQAGSSKRSASQAESRSETADTLA